MLQDRISESQNVGPKLTTMKSVEQELTSIRKMNSTESGQSRQSLLLSTLQKVASIDRIRHPVPTFQHLFSDLSSKDDKLADPISTMRGLDAEAYQKLENLVNMRRIENQHRKLSEDLSLHTLERGLQGFGSPAAFKFNNFVEEKSQNGSAFGSVDFNQFGEFNNIFQDKSKEAKAKPQEMSKTTQVTTQIQPEEDSEESKSQGKKKDLALRSDVMNKNIFRAFRRELKDTFEEYLSSVLYFNPKSKRNFINNVKKFSEHLFSLTNPSLKPDTDFDKELLTKYLGILLNFCLMKRKFKESEDQKLVKDINTLLYSYSHRRFYEFLAIPEVKLIVNSLLSHIGVDEFVKKHESLNTHSQEYAKHVKKIIRRL